jgi:hypothetical protein
MTTLQGAMPTTKQNDAPAAEQIAAYLALYEHFNARLFAGELPGVILNFCRKAGCMGFFAPRRWAKGDAVTHELSINPDILNHPNPTEVCQTLVHEMVHLWQEELGKPSRRGYHNAEWADKMESIGLMPSSTGAPGGARVGQKMADYVIEGGLFALAFAELGGKSFPWRSGGAGAGAGTPTKPPKVRDRSKVKYTCPGCGANVWGKLGLSISCDECGCGFQAAEEGEGD